MLFHGVQVFRKCDYSAELLTAEMWGFERRSQGCHKPLLQVSVKEKPDKDGKLILAADRQCSPWILGSI